MTRLWRVGLVWLLAPSWGWAAASGDFDGSTSKIVNTSAVVAQAPLSFGCWFNTDDVTNDTTLINVNDTAGTADAFALDAAGTTAGDPIRFFARRTTSAGADTTTGMSASTWMYAFGSEITSASREAYIDRGSQGTSALDRVPVGLDATAVGVRNRSSDTQFFNGRLSYCTAHTRAVGLTEQIELSWRPGMIPLNLVLFWPIWGDATEPDLSGSGNTGTVTAVSASADGPPVMIGDAPL